MELTVEDLAKMRAEYAQATTQHVAQRATMKNGILDSSENQEIIERNQFTFSIDIDSEAVANQNQSGRCWMYACLNTLRWHVEKDLKLPKGSFELSQNYTFFYDKLEKCNFFHQQIIDTAEAPLDDRRVTFLLNTPQQDGGDFDIIAAIVKKYGVVPKKCMDETHASINSAELNTILNKLLRQHAIILRAMVIEEKSAEAISQARQKMLSEIYHVLAVALGTPPEKIDFEYRDTDNKYHGDFGLTPLEFLKKYIPIDLDDYVGVINVPIESMPYNRVYGVEMSNEIIKGRPNRYLNVPMEELKAVALKQLQAGEPIWFGCDVMQYADIHKGVLDPELFSFGELFGVEFTMDKSQRYLMHDSLPTHAMTIAGVDMVDGKPARWKIENSWGADVHNQKVGDDGYYVMSDEWMDNFVYEVAVRKDLLPDDLRKLLDTEPIILPYWSTFNPI